MSPELYPGTEAGSNWAGVGVPAVTVDAAIGMLRGDLVGAVTRDILSGEEEFVFCFVEADESIDGRGDQCEVTHDDGNRSLDEKKNESCFRKRVRTQTILQYLPRRSPLWLLAGRSGLIQTH